MLIRSIVGMDEIEVRKRFSDFWKEHFGLSIQRQRTRRMAEFCSSNLVGCQNGRIQGTQLLLWNPSSTALSKFTSE